MRRLTFLPLLLAILWLPGCAAVTAVSIVPGALIEVVANQFNGKEKSFPRNIRTTLAAAQSSLHSMKLDVDVLEIQDNGYAIAFGNENLDGKITLEEMTPRLTTVCVKVRGKTRKESVELAIVESIQAKLARMNSKQRFHFAGYHNLRAEPDIKTARLGWYRKSAKLEAYRKGKSNWFRLKLPSGKTAYLKDDKVSGPSFALNK
jgi:hypothetical protein